MMGLGFCSRLWASIILGLVLFVGIGCSQGCDERFVSTSSPESKNGSFRAKPWLNPGNHVRQCSFVFEGQEGERVSIQFDEFDLDGTPPECYHEHLDLFSELTTSEVAQLIETPFGGRYCGRIPPRNHISLYHVVAFVFVSDRNNVTQKRFGGTFKFIPDDRYQVGTPLPETSGPRSESCSFSFLSSSKKQGELMTPTYPGTYPKHMRCHYKFVAEKGERLRIEFRDFDLFYGGAHCPFDYVTAYDGSSESAPKIGTYCGQMRNLVLYSTSGDLFLVFNTLKRKAAVQNRGFYALYEFADTFVKLDFIQSDAEHIRGSECDQRILSRGGNSGMLFSPNYPFPYHPYVVCRYFIYGMQDDQNLERVILDFEKFHVPSDSEEIEGRVQRRMEEEQGEMVDNCPDGYVRVYVRGQEKDHDYHDFDHQFCGRQLPPQVKTPGPRLVLLFNAGTGAGSGFKAEYRFETEYLIPEGTPAPDGSCTFTYRSSSSKNGRFNSPRHPSNYPSDTNCTYLFYANANEQVGIGFDNFKVRADEVTQNEALGDWRAYGREQCHEDWLEIYQLYDDDREELLGRYCDSSAPGPVVSQRNLATGLKVVLHTDSEQVYSGFMARYVFFGEKSIYGEECGGNITGQSAGVITSPNYPQKYSDNSMEGGSRQCHWFVQVRPGYRVLMHLQDFEVEGDNIKRGCPAATLRVWLEPDRMPLELCGDNLKHNAQLLSYSNHLRFSFLISEKAVGAKGFKAVWTEVLADGSRCSGFLCHVSTFCIDADLKCNDISNCGLDDDSDEIDCVKESEMDEFFAFTFFSLVLGLSLISALVLCHRQSRRRQRLEHPLMPEQRFHRNSAASIGERFANSSSMDSV